VKGIWCSPIKKKSLKPNSGYYTYRHGNVTRKFPLHLSLYKNVIFSIAKSENKRFQQVLPGEMVPIGGGEDRGKPIGGSI
jgi:hypothetical protein